MDMCINHLPASKERLEEYIRAQNADSICKLAIEYCCTRWPGKGSHQAILGSSWNADLAKRPTPSWQQNRCTYLPPKGNTREDSPRAPGHSKMMPKSKYFSVVAWTPKPDQRMGGTMSTVCKRKYPTQRTIGSSRLPMAKSCYRFISAWGYLLVVDHFSRFPKVIKLTSSTTQNVIVALKPLFARYGTPQEVTTIFSILHKSVQTLWNNTHSSIRVAHTFPKAMDRQREEFKQ